MTAHALSSTPNPTVGMRAVIDRAYNASVPVSLSFVPWRK